MGTPDEERHMAHPNEEIVRQGYKAFGEGDMDTLGTLFAPDAVHSAPGNNPLSGEYKGVDDVFGYYGQLSERSNGTFAAELKSTKAEGDDTVIATHHSTGQRGDKTLDQDETLTFTISSGKITRVAEKHADPSAYDAFWS
jgi:ketosteroid isomerase-like protein